MNQEMTDVPEYRQYKNAPSQNAIDEAYQRGYKNGLLQALDAIEEKLMQLLELRKNPRHGDE